MNAMSDDCCNPEAGPGLTRRHLLVGGAVAGTVLVTRALPGLGQETGSTTTSDPTTTTSTTTSSTTTAPAPPTTTAPPTTAPPATTTPPAATDSVPAHGDVAAPTTNRAFGTLLSDSPNLGIMFPVFPNSATSWTRSQDTYGACRSGCARRHQGEDLMAPKMTKLLAVKSGTVVELRHRAQPSGNSLYIRGDDGWFYCYLHINNDVPGTDNAGNRVDQAWGPGLRRFATGATSMNEVAARGYRVTQGEVLAYVGDSGNAEDSGSHLHFEIRKPASGSYSSETSRLWQSASVNPRESLRGAIPAREGGAVPATAFHPWNNSDEFVKRQYADLLQRTAAAANVSYWGGLLNSGEKTPHGMMAYFLESDECDVKAQSIARLYRAFFRRDPDYTGLKYWMDKARSGMTLNKVSENFVKVPEFGRMYGQLDDSGFIDLVYRNVLGRDADGAGKQFWLSEIARGVSRGRIMSHFAQSPENRAAQDEAMHVIAVYALMFKRAPSPEERYTWTAHLAGTGDGAGRTEAMVNMLRHSAEYKTVVGK